MTRMLPLVLLAGCLMTRWRIGPEDDATESPRGSPDPPPGLTWENALEQLEALKSELAELAAKGWLFEIPQRTEKIRSLAPHLKALATRDLADRIQEEVAEAGALLQDFGAAARRAAQEGSGESLKMIIEEIPPQIERLARFEGLSDEYEVKTKIDRGAPNTYRRAMARLRAIHGSMKDKVASGDLQAVAAVAEHLVLVGRSIEALMVNNIEYPVGQQARRAAGILLEASQRMKAAAEREDAERVRLELRALEEAVGTLRTMFEAVRSAMQKDQ